MTVRNTGGALLAGLLLAGCIVEPPGPPSITTEFIGAQFTLTDDQPVAVRALEFGAEPGAMAVAGVEGYIEVVSKGGGGPFGPHHDDVWLSILDADSGQASDAPDGIGHASVDGWGHGVRCDGKSAAEASGYSNRPEPPCRARWIVISRWLDPEPDLDVALELNANMRAYARDVPRASDVFALSAFGITEASDLTFDGRPVVAGATLSGSARVTPASEPAVRHFTLRVPAELTEGPNGYPRLGRIFVGTTVTEWTGPPDEARATLSIGDRSTSPYAGIAGELEWLSLCDPGAPCALPLDLTTTYWESTGSGKTPSPDGAIAFNWRIEARLEDYSSGVSMPYGLQLIER